MKVFHTWQLLIIAGLFAFYFRFFLWPKWSCWYKLWVAERLLKRLANDREHYTPEEQAEHLRVAKAIKRIRQNIEDYEKEDE